jgi:hypothetical protein
VGRLGLLTDDPPPLFLVTTVDVDVAVGIADMVMAAGSIGPI